jgi:predicted dehydrogenase
LQVESFISGDRKFKPFQEYLVYVTEVKVYQIGVGSFGRYGFEKLVDMHNHLKEVDIEFTGVCDKDPEHLEAAEKFAEANNVEIESFRDTEEMYSHAENQDCSVMIYDAGSTSTHATHIYESMQRGFFHIAEKPPSMTREQHIKEKKLAEEHGVMWKVDFIERESSVTQKAVEIIDGKQIDNLKAFRESSAGIQKMVEPAKRTEVKGGDILDKMINEIYLLDMLEASKGDYSTTVEDVHAFFMPKKQSSDSMMNIYGSKTREIEDAATARTSATLSTGDTNVEINTSWIGVSNDSREIEAEHNLDLVESSYTGAGDKAFLDEECRFFVVEGEVNLLGDLLHGRLHDLDSGEEIETPDLLHDQLYRVLKNGVLNAAGERDDKVSEKETEEFIDTLFDIRDQAVDNSGKFFDELEEAQRIIRQKVVDDKKILDAEESSTIAG